MFLQCLREYAHTHNLPPVGCAIVPIRYIICLDEQGRVKEIADTATPEYKRGATCAVPDYGGRTSGNFAILLADHAQYTLGMAIPKKNPRPTAERHRLYTMLMAACAEATKEPAISAVVRFLESFRLEDLSLPEDFDPSAKITFSVAGTFPGSLASVRAWWAQRVSTADPARLLECLVCGRLCHPLTILPTQIHGVPGGQPTGMALISGQVEAAESYGLERAHYAAICEVCAHECSTALNMLLKQRETHTAIGEIVYVYWSDSASSPFSEITEARPHEIDVLLSSAWRGDLDCESSAPFRMAALKANAARVVVCDWIDSTLLHVRENVRRYFAMQQIIDATGEYRSFPLWQLAAEAGERSEAALLRCALAGGALPLRLIHPITRRIARADIAAVQAALLKMILLSQREDDVEQQFRELEVECVDPAYLCGRIFTTLETIEWKAQGAISHGVKNYYASASCRPAAIFAILLRRAGWHLKKMQKDKEKFGAYFGLNRQLQLLLALLGDFPGALDLPGQAMFALGYYHQRAANQQAIASALLVKKGATPQESEKEHDSTDVL